MTHRSWNLTTEYYWLTERNSEKGLGGAYKKILLKKGRIFYKRARITFIVIFISVNVIETFRCFFFRLTRKRQGEALGIFVGMSIKNFIAKIISEAAMQWPGFLS